MINTEQLLKDLDAIFLTWPELAEDEELRQHVLASGTDFHAALTVYLEEMRAAETLCEGIQSRMRTLSERKTRLERKSDAMRALMQKLIEHANEQKVTLPEATISLRTIPPKVIIEDEAQIPDLYMILTKTPDKRLIHSSLKDGEVIPGVTLSNGGTGITVRCR